MNGPCKLHQVRIRVNPSARRPVQLRLPGQAEYVVGLQRADVPRGYVAGIPAEDGWMLIHHPRMPGTLVGLPLGATANDTSSWCKAWEDELVFLEVCVGGQWMDVDDWSALAHIRITS